MKYYIDNLGIVHVIEQGQEFLVQSNWILMTDIEVESFKNPPKTQEQILLDYKSMKDGAVETMLTTHRYDSLATVKLWADDATFGAEATQILNWYKALTLMSIQLENDVIAGIVPMPTEVEYQTMIDAVVF